MSRGKLFTLLIHAIPLHGLSDLLKSQKKIYKGTGRRIDDKQNGPKSQEHNEKSTSLVGGEKPINCRTKFK